MANEDKKTNPYIGITANVCVFTFLIALAIALFAKEWAWVIIFVVAFMALLGIMLGHFAFKESQKPPMKKR